MSVRQSLLAILDQGPCYGYQLRTEFDRRTGSTWPINVGQIYNTLDRLERDKLIRRVETGAEVAQQMVHGGQGVGQVVAALEIGGGELFAGVQVEERQAARRERVGPRDAAPETDREACAGQPNGAPQHSATMHRHTHLDEPWRQRS